MKLAIKLLSILAFLGLGAHAQSDSSAPAQGGMKKSSADRAPAKTKKKKKHSKKKKTS